MQLELSDRQRTTIGAALTILAAGIIVAAAALLFWTIATFVKAFSSVFLSLAVAAVAAFVFRPYYAWLHRRGLPASIAIVVVMLSMLLPAVAFAWFFGGLLLHQLTDLVERAPALWSERIFPFVKERWPKVLAFLDGHPIGIRIRGVLEGRQEVVVQALEFLGGQAWLAGQSVMRASGALLSWAVLPIYFAFFLMAEPGSFSRPEQMLPFLKEDTRKDVVYLVREFVNIIVAFFRGQLLVAFLMGILFAIAFSLIGLKYGLVLGLVLGLLNTIPYLGSIVGLSIAVPLALFQPDGGAALLGWTVATFVFVQTVEGYILTPRVMGERTGLHPLAIIVSVFFWGAALDGIMGMILAIPLTAFLVVFWRLAREKYIGELV